MAGTSTKTRIVAFRLPLDVLEILERRVGGEKSHWDSVAAYLQERIIYDVRRPHKKGKSSDIADPDPNFFKRRTGHRESGKREH